MLTRKHYNKMAEITSARGNYLDRVEVYTDFLYWIYEDGNPNFNLDRFRRACGLSAELHPELLSIEAHTEETSRT
jgi:hypothetical protein